ncbi:MAG: hypothetical protein ACE5R4_11935 [Armatimonadota bacterium]
MDLGRWLSAGWGIIKEDILTFAVASLVVVLLSMITFGLLGPAMQCGLFMMAYRKMTYGQVEIGHVMEGTRRFVPALLAALILLIPVVALYAICYGPTFVIQMGTPDDRAALAIANVWQMVSSTVLFALLYGAVLFALPHIAARNVGPVDALTASYEVFRRNILMFAVTGFLFSLISSLGGLACCIGVFVSMPFIAAAQAQAYADHFGIAGFDAV